MMKKRILSLFLVVCILSVSVSMFPMGASAATSGKCGSNLTWTFDAGTLTISGTGDMYDYSYNGPWNSIREQIKTAKIDNSVTSIGDSAFYYFKSLTSITIPDSVTSIGRYAFSNCYSLTSVTIPDKVTSIGDGVFSNCYSLTSVTIPDKVTSIGKHAFSNCESLSDVYYSGSESDWEKISLGVYNDSLTNANIHYDCGTGTNISSGTCGDNLTWTFDAGTLTISGTGDMYDYDYYYGNYATWYSVREQIKTVKIDNGVTSIGEYAFSNCESLTSITIPDSVTSIGDCAFYYCESLTSVTIGNSVTSIGDWAFSNCESLTSITIPDSVTSIGRYAFSNCYSLTSVTIPDSVTSIGDGVFSNCESLSDVYYSGSESDWEKISLGVYNDSLTNANIHYDCGAGTNISSGTCGDNLTWTFDAGTLTISGTGNMYDYDRYSNYAPWKSVSEQIKTVKIDNGVTSIGNEAFYYCESLTSVTIGNSVTSICERAFTSCESLTSITIPDSVTSIGNEAFSYCESLTSVTIGNSVTSIGDWAFSNCESLTSITIPDSVTSIGNYAFYDCYSLTSITIPNSVTSIGDRAFHDCKGLTGVTIGNSVTSIGFEAFHDCESLTSVTIGNSVTSIGDRAFYYCESLTSITIPDSVTSIGYEAFYSCESLTSVTIGNSVTSIGDDAFSWCTSLTSITIPDSVTRIGIYAFYYCTGLTNVTIPGSVTSIGEMAFTCCYSLTNVTIPDSVTSIGDGVFSSCYSLTSVTIGNSVTSIGDKAFVDCESLTSVTIGNSVTSIGERAFFDCYRLKDVYYSGSKTDWGKISIGSYNEYLTKATIHYNSSGAVIPEYNEPSQKFGVFQFASECGNKEGDNGNSIANYFYDDNYFASSSMNNYNHDLSKMSLRLAMSAFAVHGIGSDKYKNQDANAKALLAELGFDEIENIGYSEKPTTNSIGVIAGNKRIAFEDDDYTLIAVAVRGKGYESEWGGNFNVGTGDEHYGFRLARDQVLSFLTNYVKKADISGNVKIWITGFSRAAATTNLTAAYLDTHSLILNGTNTDPAKIIDIKPENIYAYCFETPAGTRASDKNDSKYSNIFSIVNQNDFVPMVAPEKWNYGRYGITYYLPTARTNSDFKSLVGNMYTYFDKYVNHDYVSWRTPVIEQFDNYKISWSLDHAYPYYGFYLKEKKSKQTMDDFLQNMIDNLAKTFESPEYYNEHLQDAMVFVGTEIMGQKKADKFGEIFVDELMSRLNPFKSVFEGIDKLSQGEKLGLLRSSIKGTFKRMSINISDEAFDGLLQLASSMLNSGSMETLIGNLNILPNVHFPELCLAWIDSTQPSEYLRNTRYMCLNCPVNLEVYDSNNSLVAAIRNNEVIDIEGSTIVAYIDANGQKVVYLPTDEEYRTEIMATDDGEVTYSIQEQNADTGETRVINYNKLTIKKDDTLTGTAENLAKTEVATYALTSNSVTVKEPEIIENALPVAITPIAVGNGNVSGGGSLLKGEYAQLIATPFENETFLGWYKGESFVTNETTYRFQVGEELTLTARFTENTCKILYVTNDEDIVAFERILKGSTATFPSMTQNPDYMILDIYTDEKHTALANKSTTYSEDTVLYAKVLTKDEWVQFDEVNNKIVVYTPTTMDDVQFLVALYKEEKLTDLKQSVVDLVVGKNEFENPIANMGTADTLKVFVWDGLSTLKPIRKNCVVVLK